MNKYQPIVRNYIGLFLLWTLMGAGGFATAEDRTLRFDLSLHDIEAARMEAKGLWIKLAPDATHNLYYLTMNQGAWLVVSVDGVDADPIRIFSTVDSGILGITNPSKEIRDKLDDYIQ